MRGKGVGAMEIIGGEVKGGLTRTAGSSGSATEGMQRVSRSRAIMQSSLPRIAAAPEPKRWAC